MATLKSLVNETSNIKNELVECHTNLKNKLTQKGVECNSSDKLPALINKVDNMQIRKYGTGVFKTVYTFPRTKYDNSTGYTSRVTYTVDSKDEYIDCVRMTPYVRKTDATSGADYYYYLGIYINGVLIKEYISTPSNLDSTGVDYLTLKKGDIIELKTKSKYARGYIEFTLEYGYISEDLAD